MSLVPALLRDDRPFRRFWAGQTVSLFGDQISLLALPLVAVLVLHAGPSAMGALTAAGVAPYLLFSLVAGGLVDRLGRRRKVMIGADLGRAALLLVVPVHALVGRPGFGELCTVAFLVGSLSVLFAVSYGSLFTSVVARDRYVEANALLSGSRSLSILGGPAAGGLLVQVLTAPAALVVDAGSFLASAWCLHGIRPDEPAAAPAGDLAGGVRFLRRSPAMRAALAATATINFGNYLYWSLFVLFLTRTLHLAPSVVGLVLAAGAVGGLAGSAASPRIIRRLGLGRSFVAGCVVFALPLLAVPAAHHVPLLLATELLSGLGVMVLDISAASLFAGLVPHELRARVQGAYLTVNYGVRPLGALAGGALGASLGIRPAIAIGAVLALSGVLWLVRSPVPGIREVQPSS
ncbi:MAG: transporter [Actinomycetia bacterium]|nr:transporter [Actinomycetes bacterium]